MKNYILKLAIFALLSQSFLFAAETIVFVRHGEKPQGGLGQINCQGLNRALKLPYILEQKYGKPSAIFAANPAKQKPDSGVIYDYIRPLATIEPAAVKFGLPVNVQYGFKEIEKLNAELTKDKYKNATVFVAWEHHLIVEAVKLLTAKNQLLKIPDWKSDDFDTIYVVTIDDEKGTIDFAVDKEGLNNLSTECP